MALVPALVVAAAVVLVGLPVLVLLLLGVLFVFLVARPSRNQITPRHVKSTYDIAKGRHTANIEGDFVIFLIGASVNKWTHVKDWATVLLHGGMPNMLQELAADPDSGFLGAQLYVGNPNLLVQYWRSMDHLQKYAKNPRARHLPAWKMWGKAYATSPTHLEGGGIYHEAYHVRAGEWEAVYNNCVPVGLGRATGLVPAVGRKKTAAGRLGKTDGGDLAPELAPYFQDGPGAKAGAKASAKDE